MQISDRMLLIISITLLSFTGLCIKNSIDSSSQLLGVTGVRSFLAIVLWFAFFRYSNWSLKEIFFVTKSQMFIGMALALTNITFVYATLLTTAHNAVFLQYIYPIWIAIISYVLWKIRVSKTDLVVLPLLCLGMALLVWDGFTSHSLIGTLVGILCGISYAFVILFLSQQVCPLARLKCLFFGNILTIVVALPFFSGLTTSSSEQWIWMLLLGIVSFGIPWIILTKVLQSVKPLDLAIFSMFGPVLNPIWVAIAPPYEIPGNIAIFGAIIIVIAILYRVVVNYSISPGVTR